MIRVKPRLALPRRRFLQSVVGAAAIGSAPAIPRVFGHDIPAELLAAPHRSGELDDVEHVVILMQENRSFDHYFGTMRGVRGFGDSSVLTDTDGASVFHQRDPERTDGGYLLPFHVDTALVDGQDLGDLGHDWADQHAAVNGGRNDGWIAAKGEMTMAYFTQEDIAFHRALADAFTVCDHYFCSVQGPTTPNRLYQWTGTIDPEGRFGGPATRNPPDYRPVYRWTTYPERLQQHGVTWQIYANDEVGDDAAHPFCGDYGDNPLWLFHAYHQGANTELARRAKVFGKNNWRPDSGQSLDVSHVLTDFIADCASGSLPQVSWIVAPYGYSEHPAARPVDGAAYTARVLTALWDNPDLWESTVLVINFDENDGYFDHVPPPMPPSGARGEFVGTTPIGLGPRVPMLAISPWSRGGWVNSHIHDHTSVIRFLEQWTGVVEPNISPWRRSLCGDLTGCFDFTTRVTTIPLLPHTAAMRAEADATQRQLPQPAPPSTGSQTFPTQEPGTRPARPLPYAATVNAALDPQRARLTTTFANTGSADLQLAVYRTDGVGAPLRYDVAAGTQVTDTRPLSDYGAVGYDVAVHGPNRFCWRLAGTAASPLGVTATITEDVSLRLTMANTGPVPVTVTVVAQRYLDDGPWRLPVAPGDTVTQTWDALTHSDGWYDLILTVDVDPTFIRAFRGHLENGAPSITG